MIPHHEDSQKEPLVLEDSEDYGDPKIAVYEGKKIPFFLILTYILLPIWGVFQFYYFWNGSAGWFDRGYWHQLQIAANTTFPIQNQNMPDEKSSDMPAQSPGISLSPDS